jgi:hypothetical protein
MAASARYSEARTICHIKSVKEGGGTEVELDMQHKIKTFLAFASYQSNYTLKIEDRYDIYDPVEAKILTVHCEVTDLYLWQPILQNSRAVPLKNVVRGRHIPVHYNIQ